MLVFVARVELKNDTMLIFVVDIFTMSSGELDETRGKWVYPAACESNSSCVYKVEWELDTKEDVIKFEIEAKQPPKTWTAIAFTDDPNMVGQWHVHHVIDNRFTV